MSLVEAIHNLNKLQAHIANQFEEKRKQKGEELLDRQWKVREREKREEGGEGGEGGRGGREEERERREGMKQRAPTDISLALLQQGQTTV